MTGTTPTRATVARSFIPAALTLAVSLPAQEPAESRNHPAPDEAVTDSVVQLGGLLGVWVRDDALSEDPIQKTESMWESPKLVPPTMSELAHPPREQTLEVRAYGLRGEYAGSDQIVVNQFDVPFAVRIVEILAEQTSGAGAARVAATISVPRSSTLERVEFYRSEELVATMHDFREEWGPGAARTIPVEALIGEVHPGDFVRVNARLDGNREREDAQLLDTANYRDEIDVQLVQLQVLVTDDAGNPVGGLSPEDFEIRENDKERPVGNLETQHDVPLVLGIAVDSSYSMRPVWPHLKHLTESFLESALTPGDQAFLVDFDTTVRLVQPLTGNKALLAGRLNRLIPMGGTALNDGLLFSLLGFRGEPGRRALVMVTDGGDRHSRSRPEQSADFAERLGLPIYFIELENTVPPADKADRRTASIPQMTMAEQRSPQLGDGVLAAKKPERFASITPLTEAPEQPKKTRKRLRRISEQTGGRHFHIELIPGTEAGTAQFEQVFDQIEEDLRHQHVLTYYSDQPPGTAIEPEVRVTRRGLRLRSVVPLDAIE